MNLTFRDRLASRVKSDEEYGSENENVFTTKMDYGIGVFFV